MDSVRGLIDSDDSFGQRSDEESSDEESSEEESSDSISID